MPDTCELCDRDVPATTVHHLYPVSKARRKGIKPHELPTAELCPDCHKQVHVLFSNAHLAERLTTVPALKREPEMQRFLSWLRKQPGDRRIRVRS